MAEDKKPANAGKDKDPEKNPTPPAPTPTPAKPKTVRVIVPEGTTLGRLMLTNGDTTADPEYVALLDIKGQKKVEAVK